MYLIRYSVGDAAIVMATPEFAAWLFALRDTRAQVRIQARIRRLSDGNPGDCASVGGGVFELRVPVGAGYRVYVCRTGARISLLLAGGDKQSQPEDIRRARDLARNSAHYFAE
ncbi:MAG: type II toxin-antitoxin system RelE/ParE family toxin [Gemmatimonadetes bacterium]|nr:type II toxin-antitoxin system RelE/ParE family toxin [Gemmatimonadota bacterium]